MTIIWVDAQLPPSVARWLTERFGDVAAQAVRSIGLREAADVAIFDAAAAAGALVLTKDDDFRRLAKSRAPAPAVALLTCGNTSNARLREILEPVVPRLLDRLGDGQRFFEIEDERALMRE